MRNLAIVIAISICFSCFAQENLPGLNRSAWVQAPNAVLFRQYPEDNTFLNACPNKLRLTASNDSSLILSCFTPGTPSSAIMSRSFDRATLSPTKDRNIESYIWGPLTTSDVVFEGSDAYAFVNTDMNGNQQVYVGKNYFNNTAAQPPLPITDNKDKLAAYKVVSIYSQNGRYVVLFKWTPAQAPPGNPDTIMLRGVDINGYNVSPYVTVVAGVTSTTQVGCAGSQTANTVYCAWYDVAAASPAPVNERFVDVMDANKSSTATSFFAAPAASTPVVLMPFSQGKYYGAIAQTADATNSIWTMKTYNGFNDSKPVTSVLETVPTATNTGRRVAFTAARGDNIGVIWRDNIDMNSYSYKVYRTNGTVFTDSVQLMNGTSASFYQPKSGSVYSTFQSGNYVYLGQVLSSSGVLLRSILSVCFSFVVLAIIF